MVLRHHATGKSPKTEDASGTTRKKAERDGRLRNDGDRLFVRTSRRIHGKQFPVAQKGPHLTDVSARTTVRHGGDGGGSSSFDTTVGSISREEVVSDGPDRLRRHLEMSSSRHHFADARNWDRWATRPERLEKKACSTTRKARVQDHAARHGLDSTRDGRGVVFASTTRDGSTS